MRELNKEFDLFVEDEEKNELQTRWDRQPALRRDAAPGTVAYGFMRGTFFNRQPEELQRFVPLSDLRLVALMTDRHYMTTAKVFHIENWHGRIKTAPPRIGSGLDKPLRFPNQRQSLQQVREALATRRGPYKVKALGQELLLCVGTISQTGRDAVAYILQRSQVESGDVLLPHLEDERLPLPGETLSLGWVEAGDELMQASAPVVVSVASVAISGNPWVCCPRKFFSAETVAESELALALCQELGKTPLSEPEGPLLRVVTRSSDLLDHGWAVHVVEEMVASVQEGFYLLAGINGIVAEIANRDDSTVIRYSNGQAEDVPLCSEDALQVRVGQEVAQGDNLACYSALPVDDLADVEGVLGAGWTFELLRRLTLSYCVPSPYGLLADYRLLPESAVSETAGLVLDFGEHISDPYKLYGPLVLPTYDRAFFCNGVHYELGRPVVGGPAYAVLESKGKTRSRHRDKVSAA